MAPSTDPDREPTLFEVLAISPRSLDGQDPASQAKIARQAYRRALLKHHPDRQAQKPDENAAASSDSSSATSGGSSQHFTVDQITEAYTVLSDAKKRREYTRALRSRAKAAAPPPSPPPPPGASANTTRKPGAGPPWPGTINLDDDMSWDGRRRLYYRACDGCGRARGFGLREDEVEDDAEEDFDVILECAGCGRSLRVSVPALADGGDAQGVRGQGGSGLWAPQPPPGHDMAADRGNREAEPPKKSRGWGLRLGLGLSLGGGVSARAGR